MELLMCDDWNSLFTRKSNPVYNIFATILEKYPNGFTMYEAGSLISNQKSIKETGFTLENLIYEYYIKGSLNYNDYLYSLNPVYEWD